MDAFPWFIPACCPEVRWQEVQFAILKIRGLEE